MEGLQEYLPTYDPLLTSRLSRKTCSRPGAYALIHRPTGQVYIGSTQDVYHRVATHFGKLRLGVHTNPNLQRLFDDTNSFELRYCFTDSPEDALAIEQSMLDRFMPLGNLMNIGATADRPVLGRILTKEQKSHLRESAKRQFASEESRQRQREYGKMAWKDPEFRAKSLRVLEAARNKHRRAVMAEGVKYSSVGDAARHYGITRPALLNRLRSPTYPSFHFCNPQENS